MYKDISAAILSGGKSSRMGTNKSLLQLNGKTVIFHLNELMNSIFENVSIITNEPELYQNIESPKFKDIHKGNGPLSGIHSALFHSKTDYVFIISCDIPLINKEIIQSIIEYPSENLIKVPKADGFIQNLCGLYHKSLIPKIEDIFSLEIGYETLENGKKKRCKIHQLIDNTATTIIENVEELNGYHKNVFINMNKPEEYEYIISKINK